MQQQQQQQHAASIGVPFVPGPMTPLRPPAMQDTPNSMPANPCQGYGTGGLSAPCFQNLHASNYVSAPGSNVLYGGGVSNTRATATPTTTTSGAGVFGLRDASTGIPDFSRIYTNVLSNAFGCSVAGKPDLCGAYAHCSLLDSTRRVSAYSPGGLSPLGGGYPPASDGSPQKSEKAASASPSTSAAAKPKKNDDTPPLIYPGEQSPGDEHLGEQFVAREFLPPVQPPQQASTEPLGSTFPSQTTYCSPQNYGYSDPYSPQRMMQGNSPQVSSEPYSSSSTSSSVPKSSSTRSDAERQSGESFSSTAANRSSPYQYHTTQYVYPQSPASPPTSAQHSVSQIQYPGQAQYAGQAQYSNQAQYQGQAQYPSPAQYPSQAQYPGQAQYPVQYSTPPVQYYVPAGYNYSPPIQTPTTTMGTPRYDYSRALDAHYRAASLAALYSNTQYPANPQYDNTATVQYPPATQYAYQGNVPSQYVGTQYPYPVPVQPANGGAGYVQYSIPNTQYQVTAHYPSVDQYTNMLQYVIPTTQPYYPPAYDPSHRLHGGYRPPSPRPSYCRRCCSCGLF